MSDDIEIANASDHAWCDTLFKVSIGAYGDTHVYVWVKGDNCDDAWEHAVDWIEDTGRIGLFSIIDEGDMRAAAKDLGLDWPCEDPDGSGDGPFDRIYDAATADVTMVGHTTLHKVYAWHRERYPDSKVYGIGIPSWEWTLSEVDGAEYDAVKARSRVESGDEDEDDSAEESAEA